MCNKKVLVTGGAGFIGGHLCKRLLEMNYEVICMDNLFSGQKSNIEELINHPCFTFVNQDVTEKIEVECEQIYNLACPASPIHYQHDPIKTAKTSFIGALNVLELATKNNAKVLQASTSEVYGNPEVHPQPENYWGHVNPDGIRSCYDEGKRVAETLFFDYHRQYGTRIKVARIFNTYGPNMREDDGRVISNFIVQALNNEDITIYGDGLQTRSFCYVDDMIDGLIRLMNSDDSFTGPVNLGNPEEISMLELANTIIRMTGSKSKVVYQSLPEDDPIKRKPLIYLAVEKLNWKPETSLYDGLEKTISYFRDNKL